MFSATGQLLSGSQHRPDIYIIVEKESCSSLQPSSGISTFNGLGYIPICSTFTGLGRVLLGIIHSIVHIACAIFDSVNQEQHLMETKLGVISIGRGLVEMIPLIGNVSLLIVDIVRRMKLENEAIEAAKDNTSYANCAILFGNGREIAQLPLTKFDHSLSESEKIKLFLIA